MVRDPKLGNNGLCQIASAESAHSASLHNKISPEPYNRDEELHLKFRKSMWPLDPLLFGAGLEKGYVDLSGCNYNPVSCV